MQRSLALAIIIAAEALAAGTGPSKLTSLPLQFEPNAGQAPREALYVARAAGYSLSIFRNGAAFQLASEKARMQPLRLRFLNSNLEPAVAAGEPLPGRVNYLLGTDATKWRKNIPTFARVNVQALYKGIDVSYYGKQGRLEYDFIVAPGADPNQIALTFDAPVRLDPNGDLLIGNRPSQMKQLKPEIYQTGPEGQRQIVEGRYVVRARRVSIALGSYDRSRALIIDPVLSYATYLGGTDNDAAAGVAVDNNGNTYVTGFTASTNFPTSAGSLQTTNRGAGVRSEARYGDAFVTKLNPAGTAVIYSTFIGGGDDDYGISLAVDGAGNVFVTGNTASLNFPTTTAAVQRSYGGKGSFPVYGYGDAFVAKLNPAGNDLIYSTYVGGSLDDSAYDIAIDSAGNAVIVGATESANFPVTANVYQRQYRGALTTSTATFYGGDGFITKLNSTGSAYTFSTYIGGNNEDLLKSVAIDAEGNVYAAGGTYSADFPTTPGAYQTTFRGREALQFANNPAGDSVIVKLNASGSAALYSTFLGGSQRDGVYGIAVDTTGAAYLCGRTNSPDFPVTSGVVQTAYGGAGAGPAVGPIFEGDAFVTKLNAAGSGLVWSTFLGGSGSEVAVDIAAQANGDVTVAGFTVSTNFPTSRDALQPVYRGSSGQVYGATGDGFVTRMNGTATAISYSSYLGGAQDDAILAIALSGTSVVHAAGVTLSTDVTTTAQALQRTFGGAAASFPRGDGFVARIDIAGIAVGPPARVAFVNATGLSGTAGGALAGPLTVEVRDANNAPVSGVAVTFAATNATANPTTATTDANGRATTAVTLGSTPGRATVTASVAGLAAASVDITVNAATANQPIITAVVNGASFQPRIAPGSYVTLAGTNLSRQTLEASVVPTPTLLGGVRVVVNNIAAPISYVSPTQVNFILPYEIGPGRASVRIETQDGSNVREFDVVSAAPGIYVFGTNRAVAQNVAPGGAVTLNTPENPAPQGGFVVIYLTGIGALDNPIPTGTVAPSQPLSRPLSQATVRLGNRQVATTFVGMTPFFVSLAQANIVIPDDLPPGDYPVVITINGVESNAPVISVRAR